MSFRIVVWNGVRVFPLPEIHSLAKGSLSMTLRRSRNGGIDSLLALRMTTGEKKEGFDYTIKEGLNPSTTCPSLGGKEVFGKRENQIFHLCPQ